MTKKGFASASSAEKVDLESVGFPRGYYFRTIYDDTKLDLLTHIIANKVYRTDQRAKAQVLEVMMVAIGINKTGCTRLKKMGRGIPDEVKIGRAHV